MKTLSIKIWSKIKWFISASGAEPIRGVIPYSKKDPLQKDHNTIETTPEKNEKLDLALFQRKAYFGNYFVGPYIFLNPDLFE